MKRVLIIFSLVLIALVAKTQSQALINYELMADADFVSKTEMLLIKACNSIAGEDTTTYSYTTVTKRHNLTQKIYLNTPEYKGIFIRAICAQGTLTSSSSDNDIEFTINSVFNDIAGVKFDD